MHGETMKFEKSTTSYFPVGGVFEINRKA